MLLYIDITSYRFSKVQPVTMITSFPEIEDIKTEKRERDIADIVHIDTDTYIYSGECSNDKQPNGYGMKYHKKDKCKYIGEYKDGKLLEDREVIVKYDCNCKIYRICKKLQFQWIWQVLYK